MPLLVSAGGLQRLCGRLPALRICTVEEPSLSCAPAERGRQTGPATGDRRCGRRDSSEASRSKSEPFTDDRIQAHLSAVTWHGVGTRLLDIPRRKDCGTPPGA
ncbi:unnamed protein product [Symbiodinium sp. CCMP2456]|nr:unnamed protein product [Symbiodinium sp. CCMP2456]